MSKEGWRSVDLPDELVEKVERLRSLRLERRPGSPVSLGLFISDVMNETLANEDIRENYPALLDEYLVQSNIVSLMDTRTSKVVDLKLQEGGLYCPVDHTDNCVHIGFAWSIPSVNKMLAQNKK